MDTEDLSDINRKQALFAAVPPVLLGLAITLEALTYDWGFNSPLTWRVYIPLLAPVLAGLLLGVVSLIAVVKQLPQWGVTWLGSFLMGLTLFVKVVAEELVDEGTITLSPTLDLILALAILLVGLVLLLLVARRGWVQAGLFTLAAAGIFGLSLLQFVMAAPFLRTDVASLAVLAGLMFGSILYLYIRRASWVRFGIILIAGLLNVGIGVLSNSVTRERLSQANGATPFIYLLVLMTFVLLSGPVAGWLVGRRRTA